jgi:nucleoside-diphosphate kinase
MDRAIREGRLNPGGDRLERTLVLVKPDGVHRGLVGAVVSRIEGKGLKLVGAKLVHPGSELVETHYAEHEGKPFYTPLVDFLTSGPVMAMVVEGEGAIAVVRNLVGPTDPAMAPPGTIRGDLGLQVSRNVVHASDSPASAVREIALWFPEGDLIDYERIDEAWVYGE